MQKEQIDFISPNVNSIDYRTN